MWFWIWFGLIGIIAASNYKRRVKPLVRKVAGGNTKGATSLAIMIMLVSLVIGSSSSSRVIFHAIAAMGAWFLLFLTREHFALNAESLNQAKQQEMNRKVAEFYEASKQQAKREAVVQPKAVVPPPPVIHSYTHPVGTSGDLTSLAVGEEVQRAYEAAAADHNNEQLMGETHWAYQAEIEKRNTRHRLVAALQRYAQQLPDDTLTAAPAPLSLFSQPRPELVPVKLLPNRTLREPVATAPRLQPPTPPAPPTPHTPATAPALAASEPAGFKYQPTLVKSRFGSSTTTS